MIEILQNIDIQLFEWINQGLSNSFFDYVLPPFRNRDTWIPLYIILFLYIIYSKKKRAWVVILLAIASIGMADGISSHILKPLVARVRPCNTAILQQEIILRLQHCSGAFSFPSSHATNHFALASFIGLVFYTQTKWFLYIGIFWATTISFAQVYVGVHFPIDVLFGAFLGVYIGCFFSYLAFWTFRFFFKS